jgi:hypothetical protein
VDLHAVDELCLRDVLDRDDDVPHGVACCGEDRREDASHAPDATVEGQLTEVDHLPREPTTDHAGGGEDRHGDREVKRHTKTQLKDLPGLGPSITPARAGPRRAAAGRGSLPYLPE